MPGTRYIGSINFSELMEKAKACHSAFNVSEKNNKIYVNVTVWLNDAPDKYGNMISIQLSSAEEYREAEGKVYVGNAKIPKPNERPLKPGDIAGIDDLPF
jgi:hypothetical protein